MSGGSDRNGGENAEGASDSTVRPRKRRKLLLGVGAVVAVITVGGGLAAGGMLPFLHHRPAAKKVADVAAAQMPVFVDLPEVIVNLDAGPHRDTFAKVQVRVEAASPTDGAQVTANTPRIIDMVQTYLRALRPDELKTGVGLYRFKEAVLARAAIVVPTAHLNDILFEELIVQ